MRTYKTTEEQIDNIIKGIDKFIDCTNYVYGNCFEYYRDMDKTNEQYKKSPTTFFDNIGVDQAHFFEGLQWYRMLDIAHKVKKDIRDIHNTVIGVFISPEGNEYPIKVKEWLYSFKSFCYDNNGNLLSLEEQNNCLKNYHHFDASVKRPKSYNTQ